LLRQRLQQVADFLALRIQQQHWLVEVMLLLQHFGQLARVIHRRLQRRNLRVVVDADDNSVALREFELSTVFD
jgi:hypothetical protein